MQLGIDRNANFVYEGDSAWGHALWPAPFITPCTFTTSATSQIQIDQHYDPLHITHIFREDVFEPISRTRRGRFYRKSDRQPCQWHVSPHPTMPKEIEESDKHGVISKHLATFISFSIWNEMSKIDQEQLLVILGTQDSFTIWSIINIEKIATGEEVVILKSRQSLGALPNLVVRNIPEEGRSKVMETLNKLGEDIYRAGPESVIDRSRDAAAAILSAYIEETGNAKSHLDLFDLIKNLKNQPRDIRKHNVINAADIVRIFHARAKPSEQTKRKIRAISEQDAELSIQCIGTILCDLGWAKWY